jgi:exodeoxyribonuclease VII large subunit
MKQNKTISLFSQKRQVLTVSEVTERIKLCLENTIGTVWVTGEVSNLRQPVSGHLYFSLKDENCQIRCVIFDFTRRLLKFQIEDGMEIIVLGRITVYKKAGDYQIIIDAVEPKGIGTLQIALEQLKRRLEAEGLFDTARKKLIPFLPRAIGIVTSLTGAALQDILNIIERRFSTIHIIIYPVKVQGEGAKEEIAQAIDDFSEFYADYIDVLIVGRGGGSIEDLWAFNEEIVARAITRSRIPVISAVGHETDYTIADLVSDKRALTPSESAEIVVPVKIELIKRLEQLYQKLQYSVHSGVEIAKTKLSTISKSYGWQQPLNRIREYYQRLDELLDKSTSYLKQKIERLSLILTEKSARLNTLSPLNVLSRGYSITRNAKNNKVVKFIKEISMGDNIITQLVDGRFDATVHKINGKK